MEISDKEYNRLVKSEKELKIIKSRLKNTKFPVMLRKMWSGGEVNEWLEYQKKEILKNRH